LTNENRDLRSVNLSGQERSATTTEDVLPFRHAPLAVQADFVNPEHMPTSRRGMDDLDEFTTGEVVGGELVWGSVGPIGPSGADHQRPLLGAIGGC
jgi:hypothetical protein